MNDNEKRRSSVKNYYQTSDLALVTTLSLFYPIDSVDKTHPRRVLFVFKRNEKLNEIIKCYWHGELKVEPQKFFNQLKNIKTRIYAQ